jgi:hypothetical protein
MQNDNMLLPLRALAEALGANVSWNGIERAVTVYHPDGRRIIMEINNSTVRVVYPTGQVDFAILDVAAIILNDRTLVPARFFAEFLGVTVEWDSVTRTAVMTTN